MIRGRIAFLFLLVCSLAAFGSASTTSARPPVFENGSPSDATNRILMNDPLPGAKPFYAIGAP